MPAIKLKKATADYIAEKEREREREKAGEENKNDKVDLLPADEEAEEESDAKKKPKAPYKSFLEGEILVEKRKRFAPVAEQKLNDWLSDNLEKRDETHINLQLLFEYYTDTCRLSGTSVMDFYSFSKAIRTQFGKTFGLKETSTLKGLVKELKVKKKSKVQAESLRLKMKDIIIEAIMAAGNPKAGIRFHNLKQYIVTKYPALRVDLKPGILRAALERGVRSGTLDLVKGVGFCGYYRISGDEDDEEEKEKSEESAAEGEETKNGEPPGGEEGEDKENVKTEDEQEVGEKKKRKRNRSKSTKPYIISKRRHINPKRIEDAFPLAVTFMCEPKEASVAKIKRYLMEYYPECNVEARLKKTLERGTEQGLWEQISGSGGGQGTYRLLISHFNPSLRDSMDDMICSAIIACTEPKRASALLIKKYIQEYHPDFNVESRPNLFKHSLERAVNGQIIVQLSGIGATGTFQLTKPFSPTPAMLAGDSEGEGSDEDEDDYREEVYIVRKTKSRRGNASSSQAASKTQVNVQRDRKKPVQRRNQGHPGRPQKKGSSAAQDSSESSDEEEEKFTARKSKSRGGSATVGKKISEALSPGLPKRSRLNNQSSLRSERSGPPEKSRSTGRPAKHSDTDDSDQKEAEYSPQKSKSRGGNNFSSEKHSKKEDKPKYVHSKKSRGSNDTSSVKRLFHAPSSEEEEEEPLHISEKSKARGKKHSPVKRSLSPTSSDEEDDEPVYVPKKSKSRGGDKLSSGWAEEEDDPVQVSKTSKARGGTPNALFRRAVTAHSDDIEDEDGIEPLYIPKKSKSRGGEISNRSPVHALVSEEEEESYVPNKSKSRGRSSKKPSTVHNPEKEEGENESSHVSGKSKSKNQNSVKRSSIRPTPSDEEEEDDELTYIPKKSKSRGGEKDFPKQSPVQTSTKNDTMDEDMEYESTLVSKKSKGKGGMPAKKATSRSTASEDSEDASGLEEEEEVEYTPRKTISRGGSPPPKSLLKSKSSKTLSDKTGRKR